MTDSGAIALVLEELRRLNSQVEQIARRLDLVEGRMAEPDEWLRTEEAVRAFGVSRAHLYRSGVRHRRVGKETRWHRAALEDMVRGRAA